MTKTINIREVALDVLLEIIEKNQKSHKVLGQALSKYQYLEKTDRAFLTRLVEGTIEKMLTLDYMIDQFSSVKSKKMKPVIRMILRMGVYQIIFLDRIPKSAACNEAVKLAKRKGFASLAGFVNGVLRTVVREQNKIIFPDPKKDLPLFLSVQYSVPEWIVQQWITDYGTDVTKLMLASASEVKKTTVRLNLLRAEKDQILELLKKDKVTFWACPYPEGAYYISDYDCLEDLEAFQKGFLQVQDTSSMLAVLGAGIKEHDFILDVCAAPGGKSLFAAELLKNSGRVEARDLTEYKLCLVQGNIDRVGVKNIDIRKWDATILDAEMIEKADAVLADLPCSGLGVIGKKNDLKYKMNLETQKQLVALQRNILSVIWQYVKPGGILLYSTCTLNHKENLENAEWFMKNYPFEMDSLIPYIDCNWFSRIEDKESLKKGYLTLLPGIHEGDGFFFIRMKRMGKEVKER